MREVANGVWQLRGAPRDMFNVYLAGDVVIDAATRWARERIFRQLRGRRVSLVALTHCHPDHQGVAAELCCRYGVPLACHEADVPAMEGKVPMVPENWLLRLGERFWSGPAHPVGRMLRDGDTVGDFRVIHAPGHTPGHVILFRAADRLAIAGDVLANINFITRKPGLRQPPPFFSVDMAENRRSIRKLLDLQPRVICFGHGPPLSDRAHLESFASRLGV